MKILMKLILIATYFMPIIVSANVPLKHSYYSGGILYQVAYSPNGKYLASTGFVSINSKWVIAIDVLDTSSNKTIKTILLKSRVDDLEFSPDSQYLSFLESSEFKIFDTDNWSPLKAFLPKEKFRQFTYNHEGNLFATANDKVIDVWDVEKKELLNTFYHQEEFLYTLDFSPNGNYIISSGSGRNYTIWDIKKNKLRKILGNVTSAEFSSNGKFLATFHSRSLKIYETNNWSLVHTLELTSEIQALAISPDNNFIALGVNNVVRLFDVQNSIKIDSFQIDFGHKTLFYILFNPDGTSITVNGNGGLKIWDFSFYNESVAKDVFSNIDKTDKKALIDFSDRFYGYFGVVDSSIKHLYTITKKQTIDDYLFFVEKYPIYSAATMAAEDIFKIVKTQNTISQYEWFIHKFSNFKIANEASINLSNILFEKAINENTLDSYNKFITSQPHSLHLVKAMVKSYNIEKESYTGWLKNDDDSSRTLLMKIIKLRLKLKELKEKDKEGLMIVINRMANLLINEFSNEDATLEFLQSSDANVFYHEIEYLKNNS